MSNVIEQFEEFYDILTEVSANYPPAAGAVAATNEPPRKDYGPMSGNGYPPSFNKKGLLDPYQSHPDTSMVDLPRPEHLPFPLDNVEELLANSAVYLLAAVKQIEAAVTNNPSIEPIFKKQLKKLNNINKDALKRVEYVGKNLSKHANLNY